MANYPNCSAVGTGDSFNVRGMRLFILLATLVHDVAPLSDPPATLQLLQDCRGAAYEERDQGFASIRVRVAEGEGGVSTTV